MREGMPLLCSASKMVKFISSPFKVFNQVFEAYKMTL
ncbi:hypothetical protein HH_1466 [Helicobacter hepaticus ATCC 51449]|uniref:Uncharacterized protein n=1 Tax=Helicobacter hepaticus (strain ATCC 51449 / 3B1) TaxID=235279 RepID=Q7VG58_HELHP|nr:hypothetical protein HH_1466 [Helicobacter hepaticus ATCC 51449]